LLQSPPKGGTPTMLSEPIRKAIIVIGMRRPMPAS
jgi:hypothetical protein